jgi:predicted MFS family arabinose efflux permease
MQRISQWLPALAGMVCLGFGSGLMAIYGFFVEDLAAEFDVGVATINTGPVALILVPGILAPVIGKLVDRLPIRRMLLVGVTVAMSALLAITVVPSLWLIAVAFVLFAVGLTFYGPVVVNGMLVKIYRGNEARALAIAAMGISFAGAILPPLLGFLLSVMPWREALASLAAGLAVLLWLVIALAVPAGVAGQADEQQEEASGDASFVRESAFWLIGLAVAMALCGTMLLAICYPPHFVARGFSLEQAGWFIAYTGMAGLVGKTVMAWIGDRARDHVRWVAGGLLLIQIAGLSLLVESQTTTAVMLSMSLLGFGTGAFIPMHPYLNARYFSAAIIGRVNGAQMPLFLPFGLLAPPLAGMSFDQHGNYDLVLQLLALTYLLAAIMLICLPRPRTVS